MEASNNKIQAKDLINVGIFTAIYFVIFFAGMMLGYIPTLFFDCDVVQAYQICRKTATPECKFARYFAGESARAANFPF